MSGYYRFTGNPLSSNAFSSAMDHNFSFWAYAIINLTSSSYTGTLGAYFRHSSNNFEGGVGEGRCYQNIVFKRKHCFSEKGVEQYRRLLKSVSVS